MSSPLTAEVVRRNSALFRHQRSRWFRNSYPSQGAALFPAELVIGAQGEIRIELQCPEICSVGRINSLNWVLGTDTALMMSMGAWPPAIPFAQRTALSPTARVAPKAESRTDSPRSSLPNTNVSKNSALRPWRSRVPLENLLKARETWLTVPGESLSLAGIYVVVPGGTAYPRTEVPMVASSSVSRSKRLEINLS